MIRPFFTDSDPRSWGWIICKPRTLVCDLSHNQSSSLAAKIEEILDSRVQAQLRKHGMSATCRVPLMQPMVATFELVCAFVLIVVTRSSPDLNSDAADQQDPY